MDKPVVTYAQRSDAVPETGLSALANIYKFVLDCHAKKNAGTGHTGDDEKVRSRNDSLATQNYTR